MPQVEARVARIVRRKETPLSPWVRLVENDVEVEREPAPGAEPGAAHAVERYHSLAQADYVTIVALTPSRKVPLVRQFRPAVGALTWELPGGLLEPGESPEACCRRELREEAGLWALTVQALGAGFPDTGRLENRIHAFAVQAAEPQPGFVPERGVALTLVSIDELRARILDGSFGHQLHLAALALAELRGFSLGLFGR